MMRAALHSWREHASTIFKKKCFQALARSSVLNPVPYIIGPSEIIVSCRHTSSQPRVKWPQIKGRGVKLIPGP
jgi:hypothetical protein